MIRKVATVRGRGLGDRKDGMPEMKPGPVQQSKGNGKPIPVPAGHPFKTYLEGAGRKRAPVFGRKPAPERS